MYHFFSGKEDLAPYNPVHFPLLWNRLLVQYMRDGLGSKVPG